MTTTMTAFQGIASRGTARGRTAFTALLGLFAVGLTGCAQETLCEELSDCGGVEPAGAWELAPGGSSCSEDLYSPPVDPRLYPGELAPARVPPLEPALYDWCTLLVTGSGAQFQVKTPLFIYESGKIGTGSVTYTPDPAAPGTGDYSAGLVRTGTYYFDFPTVCMRAWGARDKPDPAIDPSGNNVHVCEQLQAPLANAGQGEGAYPNIDCYPNLDASDPSLTPQEAERQRAHEASGIPPDPGGCICKFDVAEAGGPSGRYRMLDSKTILHMSGSFPTRATFCNQGNRLQLTGADGSYLFGIKSLRTLDLGRVP